MLCLCRKKPGVMFDLGTRNDDPATALPLHNAGVVFDEGCFETGINVFVQFVLDNMGGIEF